MRQTREGRKFTRLTVVRMTAKNRYDCVCVCGKQTNVHWMNLLKGNTKSCGCLAAERNERHITEHPLYQTWIGMRDRCRNPNNPNYHRYGGRGIKVCKKWQENFEAFVLDMGPKPEDKNSIDRVNNEGNYEPNNCRWATHLEQLNNTSKCSRTMEERQTQIDRKFEQQEYRRVVAAINKLPFSNRSHPPQEPSPPLPPEQELSCLFQKSGVFKKFLGKKN